MNEIGSEITTGYRSELISLNKLRKKLLRKLFFLELFNVIFFITLFKLFGFFVGAFATCIMLIFSHVFFFILTGKKYRQTFKEKISKQVLNNFFKHGSYNATKSLSAMQARESRLFTFFEECSGEDCVTGAIEECKYEFSEIKLTKTEHYRDSDGDQKERTVTVFAGILMCLKLKDAVNIFVEYHSEQKSRFKFPKLFGRRKKKRISLEDIGKSKSHSLQQTFEQRGASEDINSSLGQNLLHILESHARPHLFKDVRLSTMKDKVYLGIGTNDFLPVPLFRSPLKVKSYMKWDQQLKITEALLEETARVLLES